MKSIAQEKEMDPRFQDDDESRKFIPSPKSATLSYYQEGLRDVDERRQKDADLGITYGPTENPYHDHSKDYEYNPEGSESNPYDKPLSALRRAVSDYVDSTEEHKRARAAAEIIDISSRLLEIKGFVGTEYFEEYKKIKEPYVRHSIKETEAKKKNRDREEIARLRKFLSEG